MNPLLRICLVVGCFGLTLLEAPKAGALLREGVAGPYGGREAHPRVEPASTSAQSSRTASVAGQLPLTTGSLRAPGDAGSLWFPGGEPWCTGLPRGL